MNNIDLFDTPIRSGKIRKGVYYHQYKNGVINIQGEKYVYYSIKEAIKRWRNKHPLK
jgi:hypothetical protein